MGENSLFADLPPPGTPTRSSTMRTLDPPRSEPVALRPSILASGISTKRSAEKVGEGGAKRVRFQSNEVEASEEQLLGAISKIASHISNPSKFSKASKLAIHLLQAGIKSSDVADAFYELLRAAMSSPSKATDMKLWADYQTLFKVVQEKIEVFDSPQQAQIRVWELWANLANQFRTDDTYVFSKAASLVRQLIDSLPEATGKDELTTEEWETEKSGEQSTLGSVSDGDSGGPCMQVDESSWEGACNEAGVESDPFGLNALLPRPSKKEERARRKRDVEAANRKVHDDAVRILREQREALLACVKLAADHYKSNWAQTIIDILVKHTYDKRSKFAVPQREAIEQLWSSIREQQSRRKQGKSTTGKLDLTAFEFLQNQYASERISIRKAVGSSGERSAEQWLG
ncbi:hypothetical protein R1sor_014134 [Riccia sorocarpa]|uniref:Uncharacterized protein n=1 Tax=Riccia sorocarpa TaxID=122646 RepID=A0ABD3H8J2_9MARC